MARIHHRTCCLCEASCGLIVEVEGERVKTIKGDHDDPLSRGHICPKAVALQDIHEDPDRLRAPMRRTATGWEEIGWDEALDEAAQGLAAVRKAHGKSALGTYLGNPSVHNYAGILTWLPFMTTLRTKNSFSATSTDQLPRVLTSYLMYGHQALVPVPDVDRTDFFLMLGANPVASGGSLMTAPDIGKRLKRLTRRGGELVVVDPRRTETAQLATQHLAIRPGGDAYLLMALLGTLFEEGLVQTGRLGPMLEGWDGIAALCQPWTPERVSPVCGLAADDIRQLALRLAKAQRAAVYGRMGTCVQRFGALCCWLIDLLNIATGNLDREGGSMFTDPAFDLVGLSARLGMKGSFNRYQSRVSGLPEFAGEIPVVALAEELEAPGDGQIKAMLTYASNPALSAPGAPRIAKAFEGLDFMVSIDLYLNETTRHANLILPGLSPLERDHYDALLLAFAVQNTARYSEPCFEPPAGAKADWEIIHGLWSRMEAIEGSTRLSRSLQRRFIGARSPKALLNAGIRLAPRGDRFLPWRKGLNLSRIAEAPHGLDLGPLTPRLPAALASGHGKIHAAPQPMLDDLQRLEAALDEKIDGNALQLIGRRHVLDNNSWMHNTPRLTKGKDRCVLYIHPDDAASRGLSDGQAVTVASEAGAVQVAVSVRDEVRPGVVSLPHGYGHGQEGTRLSVANQNAGVNVNALTHAGLFDRLSGNAALNGVPVTVTAA